MAKDFIERRIIKAGIKLSERRIEQRGTPITADDIRKLEVRTIPPLLQMNFMVLGALMMVLAIWFHFDIRNMAVSIGLLFVGFGNIAYAGYGKPKRVSELEGNLDLSEISAEIVGQFVKKMEK